MVQQITDQSWQAEARSEETRQFIKNIKPLPAASSPPKRRSVSSKKAFDGIHPSETTIRESLFDIKSFLR